MKTIHQSGNQSRNFAWKRRQGTLMPAIAFALLVVGSAIALVLNVIWKDNATSELHAVAEAVALAAAGEFLNDQLLLDEVDQDSLAEYAKQKAAQVAASNLVSGRPVSLNVSEESDDIVFGQRRYSEELQETVLLRGGAHADRVEVRLQKSRFWGNPIELFFPGVTGQPYADIQAVSVARFSNQIDCFEAGVYNVPALPLAILADDQTGQRTDTWSFCIEQKQGQDQYRYDEETRQVVSGSDGIPEIELTFFQVNESGGSVNVQLVDLNNGLYEKSLVTQIDEGLDKQALEPFSGRLSTHESISLGGTGQVSEELKQAFERQVGKQKLCLLYHQSKSVSVPGWSNLQVRGVVAVRMLKVLSFSENRVTLIVQPTVMTTRTAVLVDYGTEENFDSSSSSQNFFSENSVEKNPYVYKLFLSR